MRGALMLLVGPPALGKTTFAQELVNIKETNEGVSYKFIHVNYDKMLAGWDPMGSEQWKQKRQAVLEFVDCIIKRLLSSNSVASDVLGEDIKLTGSEMFVVIIDDNMYYKSMRLEYYRLAQSLRCGFCQIYFQGAVNESLAVNEKRTSIDKVPHSVIENMFLKIERPDLGNKWEKHTLFIPAFSIFNYDAVAYLLDTVFKDEIELPCNSISPTQLVPVPESKLHILDLTMRKHISKCVTEEREKGTLADVPSLTSKLLRKKAFLLSSIRNGQIPLPESNFSNFVEKMFQE